MSLLAVGCHKKKGGSDDADGSSSSSSSGDGAAAVGAGAFLRQGLERIKGNSGATAQDEIRTNNDKDEDSSEWDHLDGTCESLCGKEGHSGKKAQDSTVDEIRALMSKMGGFGKIESDSENGEEEQQEPTYKDI